MALFKITGTAPAPDADTPSANARLGRHGTIRHWWTLMEAVTAGLPQRVAPRIGSVDAESAAEDFVFEQKFGRNYPLFQNFQQSRSNYFSVPVEDLPPVFSVVSLHEFTMNGSMAWGVSFAEPNVVGPSIATNILIQPNGVDARLSIVDAPISDYVPFEGSGRALSGQTFLLNTVVNTETWDVTLWRKAVTPVTINVAEYMGATAIPPVSTFNIGAQNAIQGSAGFTFETMLIEGDIREQPVLSDEVSEYFATYYQV